MIAYLSTAGNIRVDPVALHECVGKILALFEESRSPEPEKRMKRSRVMAVQCRQCGNCRLDDSTLVACTNVDCSCHENPDFEKVPPLTLMFF